MRLFRFRNTKYYKLVTRLETLLKSKDDIPHCVWQMLTDLGDELNNYSELSVAKSLRDRIDSRMTEQANRPIPDFVPRRMK